MTQDKILKYCMALGFTETPGQQSLKDSYRKLIFEWHPDRHSTDSLKSEIAHNKALEINEAFEFLSEAQETYAVPPTSAEYDFDKYSREYKTKHTYQNQSFEPGFPDPHVFEVFLKSSHIISTGYIRNTKILYVKFNPNSVYRYYDVPESTFEDFINAPSHGRYLGENIAHKFKYERCSEPNQPYRGNQNLSG